MRNIPTLCKYEYNPNGKIVNEKVYLCNKDNKHIEGTEPILVSETCYKYRIDTSLLSVTVYNYNPNDGARITVSERIYDPAGNLIKLNEDNDRYVRVIKNGKLISEKDNIKTTTYTYDDNDELIKVYYSYDTLNDEEKYPSYVEYNNTDNCVKEIAYDKYGYIINHVTKLFDDRNNVVYCNDNGLISYFIYDSENILIRSDSFYSAVFDMRITKMEPSAYKSHYRLERDNDGNISRVMHISKTLTNETVTETLTNYHTPEKHIRKSTKTFVDGRLKSYTLYDTDGHVTDTYESNNNICKFVKFPDDQYIETKIHYINKNNIIKSEKVYDQNSGHISKIYFYKCHNVIEQDVAEYMVKTLMSASWNPIETRSYEYEFDNGKIKKESLNIYKLSDGTSLLARELKYNNDGMVYEQYESGEIIMDDRPYYYNFNDNNEEDDSNGFVSNIKKDI